MKQDIEEYDKQNDTELARFISYLERGKKLNDGESRYFKVGITGDLLHKYGMNGKISIGHSTFNKRHSVDGHELNVIDWIEIINNINKPIAIAKYTKRKKAYRIYTPIIIHKQYICVGVDVNVEAKDIDVTNISTAFGRELNRICRGNYEELLYPSSYEELEKALEEHSTAPNSRLYPQELGAKIQQFFIRAAKFFKKI